MTPSTAVLTWGVAMLLLCTASPVQADTLTITARQTTVRAGPTATQARLTTVSQGAMYALLDTRAGWYKIRLDDGREGWIASTTARVQGERGFGVTPEPPRPSLAPVAPTSTPVETAPARKVGVVDLQAVLNQSVSGRAAKDRLRDLGDRLQQESQVKLARKRETEEALWTMQAAFQNKDIQAKLKLRRETEEALLTLQVELRTKKYVLTEQARAAMDAEYRHKTQALQRVSKELDVLTAQAPEAMDAAYRHKAQEVQRLQDESERFIAEATRELRAGEIRETDHLLSVVLEIVEAMRKTEGYSQVGLIKDNQVRDLPTKGSDGKMHFAQKILTDFDPKKAIDLTSKIIERADQLSARNSAFAK